MAMVDASGEANITRTFISAAVDQAYESSESLPPENTGQNIRAAAWNELAEMWANAEYWAAVRLNELRNLERARDNWQSFNCNAETAGLAELDSLLSATDSSIYTVEHIMGLRNRFLPIELLEAENELTKYRTWHREAVVWAYALGWEFWE